MKIGTLGYRTKTGLGYQVLSYTKHLPIERVLVVDLSVHNGLPLTDWYPGAQTVKGYPTNRDLVEFLSGLDIVLLAETPLNYELYSLARERGVKTVTVHNYEFFDHFVNPEYPLPDMFISPSMWHFEDIERFCIERGIAHKYLHHPVDRQDFPFRQRTNTTPFHIAGKHAAYDRNGTFDYLAAFPQGRVTTQGEQFANTLRGLYRLSKIYTNIEDPNYMYSMGDILVFPRRYGGNCLPLNEALSCGVPVIMPDISPNNNFLPKHWLVPAIKTGEFTPRTKIDIYSVNPDDLRAKVEDLKANIAGESKLADEIAQSISWEVLKPKYLETLEAACGLSVSDKLKTLNPLPLS